MGEAQNPQTTNIQWFVQRKRDKLHDVIERRHCLMIQLNNIFLGIVIVYRETRGC